MCSIHYVSVPSVDYIVPAAVEVVAVVLKRIAIFAIQIFGLQNERISINLLSNTMC